MNNNKPIVLLVDEIMYVNGEQYIKTAYESIFDKLTLPRADIGGWGNSFITNHYGETRSFGEPIIKHRSIRYETLTNSTIDKTTANYIYLIPCRQETDVGSLMYLWSMTVPNIQKIADNNITILFDYSLEVYDYRRFGTVGIERCIEMIRRYNPNYSAKILVSSANYHPGNYPADQMIQIHLPIRAIQERIGYKYHPSSVEIDFDRYLTAEKKYLFLNLNLQPRVHRIFFLQRLLASRLDKHALYSFATLYDKNIYPDCQHNNWRIDLHNALHLISKKSQGVTELDLLTLYNTVTNTLQPKTLDSDIVFEGLDQNFVYNTEWVYSTCFEIVAETGGFVDYPESSPVMSEKIFKSIFLKRPFMINGDCGNIRFLKSFGFNTFEDLFDESYDSYINMFDRHDVIFRNIEMYKDNYQQFMNKVKDSRQKIEYNYHLLMDEGSLENMILRILNAAL
jgi:hypothetical protein